MKKALTLSLKLLIFIVGVWLIIVNQKTVGHQNLLLMVLGLAMLIGLIYSYNKKFQ